MTTRSTAFRQTSSEKLFATEIFWNQWGTLTEKWDTDFSCFFSPHMLSFSVLLSFPVVHIYIDTFSFHFPVSTSAFPTEEWVLPSVSLCFCHQGTMSLTKPHIKCHKDLVSHGTLMIQGWWSGMHPISMIPLPGLAIKTQKGSVCPKDTLLYVLWLCWK